MPGSPGSSYSGEIDAVERARQARLGLLPAEAVAERAESAGCCAARSLPDAVAARLTRHGAIALDGVAAAARSCRGRLTRRPFASSAHAASRGARSDPVTRGDRACRDAHAL